MAVANALPPEEPVFISATQLDTWRRCQRKWAWDKLDRIPRTPNKYAELGSRVHAVLESWLRDGTAIDMDTKEGKIALAGLQHLPPPKTGMVEAQFTFGFDGEDFLFTGFVDWQDDETVLDHKTTGDLKWAKKPEDLDDDVQATLYAASKFVHNAKLAEVLLRWIYYRTKRTPKSQPVERTVSREACEKRMLPILDDARDIAAARRRGGTALDFEPNMNECDAFGGCPYAKHCDLTSAQRMKALMAQSMLAEKLEKDTMGMSLADKLKSKNKTVNAPEGETKEEAPAEKPETTTTTTTTAAPAATATASIDTDMFVRDRFAASAMQAILTARLTGPADADGLALEAFAIADAMMKVRAE